MITAIKTLDRTASTFKADVDELFGVGMPQLAAEINAVIESGSFGTELLGFRNKVIGDFSVNKRDLTSVTDDEYCCDRWYALTETGSVTAGQVVDPEQGAPWAWKLTQPDTVAKRMGLATIIESKNVRAYRGQAMNLSMRVKPSFSGNVRYAIIEHTGTADVVTSDVVNNWNSVTFTAGNFFIAGLNIIKTGTVAPGASTYGDIDDHGIFGASLNNAILLVWSESAQIQGATLEMNRPQFEPGIISTPHEWHLDEDDLCSRYLFKIGGSPSGTDYCASGHIGAGGNQVFVRANIPKMRASPIFTPVGSWATTCAQVNGTAYAAALTGSSDRNVSITLTHSTAIYSGYIGYPAFAAGVGLLSAEL